MTLIRRARSRAGRRLVAVAGVAIAVTVAATLPALGHASFPASAVFGFAPNTSGGTGAPGSTPPYATGSTQTLYLRAAGEQADPYPNPPVPPGEPNPDTTIEVKAIVPAGWTNPVVARRRRPSTTRRPTTPTSRAPTSRAGTVRS